MLSLLFRNFIASSISLAYRGLRSPSPWSPTATPLGCGSILPGPPRVGSHRAPMPAGFTRSCRVCLDLSKLAERLG